MLQPIPSEKPFYWASEDGQIYSSALFGRKKCKSQRVTTPEHRKIKLRPTINSQGDLIVGVSNRKIRLVAELIIETFDRPRPSRNHILWFIDNNPLNPAASNIIWLDKLSADVRKVALLTNEPVRAVPNYPGYFCTASGQVISTKRRRAFFLKPTVNEGGYHRVALSGRHMYVHRIVAAAFKLHRPPGCDQVRHLIDKSDNRPDCLKWGTHFENNFLDKQEHGTLKLSFTAAAEIRQALSQGATQTELGRAYNVSRSMIGAIHTGKTWQEREAVLV